MKKTISTILAILLFCAFAVRAFPVQVRAVEEHGLIFDASSGLLYLDDGFDTAAPGQGTTWTGAPNDLTLTGFEWVTSALFALEIINGSVEINIDGTNTITSTNATDDYTAAIASRTDGNNITINGGGTLNVSTTAAAGGNAGIQAPSLTITGGTVNAKANGGTGIIAVRGGVSVTGGNVNASGGVGIYAAYVLSVTGGTVTAQGTGNAIVFFTLFPDIELPEEYNYWTNTSNSHPGGAGTAIPGGAAYSYSAGDKYVKIQSGIYIPEPLDPDNLPEPNEPEDIPQAGDGNNLNLYIPAGVFLLIVIFSLRKANKNSSLQAKLHML